MTYDQEKQARKEVVAHLKKSGWQNSGPKRWVNPDGFTIDLDAVTWQTGEARAMWAVIYEEITPNDNHNTTGGVTRDETTQAVDG